MHRHIVEQARFADFGGDENACFPVELCNGRKRNSVADRQVVNLREAQVEQFLLGTGAGRLTFTDLTATDVSSLQNEIELTGGGALGFCQVDVTR